MDIARLFDCPLCTGIPEREREQFMEGFDYSVKRRVPVPLYLAGGGSRGGNDG